MRLILLTILLSFSAFAATAADCGDAEGRRAPWEWTLEERLAARFDTGLAKQRAAFARAEAAEVGAPATAVADDPYAVDGRRNPELFLPAELFGQLLDGLAHDPNFRDVSRSVLRDGIRDFGFDEDAFWRDLARLSSGFVDLSAKRAALENTLRTAGPTEQRELRKQLEDLGRKLCAQRVAALANARRYFGQEKFDRFLYTVVAPGLAVASAPSVDAAHLRFLEGGCR